jgi:hypothetical protein
LKYLELEKQYLELKVARLNAFSTSIDFPFFSAPDDVENFNNSCITADIVSHIYSQYVDTERSKESSQLCRSFNGLKLIIMFLFELANRFLGEALSFDQTFSVAGKATVVSSDRNYIKPMVNQLEVINERSQILTWV